MALPLGMHIYAVKLLTRCAVLCSRQRQRLKELQARAFALIGSALVAVPIGCANFIARVLFQEYYGVER